MGLRVGLTYNLKTDYPQGIHFGEDASAEYESEETVGGIITALEQLGHEVIALPYNRELLDKLRCHQLDLVFNIAEGWLGRNRESLVPAILEFLDIPYTGSDPLTLGLALDKSLCKEVVGATGVAITRGIKVTTSGDPRLDGVHYPVFIKPNAEGSSKGIRNWSRIENAIELKEKMDWLLTNYQQPVLVEEFLPGREFTVAVIGNTDPKTLPIMEVLPGEECPKNTHFIYSFETKNGNLERFSCPAVIESRLLKEISEMALQVYKTLQCRDVARIDIRLDGQGNPRFLEVNPLPGLSAVSLLTLQAEAAGMSFIDLIDAICSAAIERYPHLKKRDYLKEAALG
ncbi:MAG: D-alanine--D-alanine ligase [Firmicutes bacterium]|nr:D-alanine--D-alanine ligase [Bacillota bacterium]